MYKDAIVEEIHRIREEYSQSFNHDLKALFADLQKQQAESGRKVVNLSRKHGLTTPMHRNKVKRSVSCRGCLCPVIGGVMRLRFW